MLLLAIFSISFLFMEKEGEGYWGLLTGAATSETTTVSVTINAAPVIFFVSPVHQQSISEATTSSVYNISFNATDADGFGDINNNSAQIRISLAGESDRFNSSCVNVTPFTTASGSGMSFNCSVNIWYFDGPGNWTINVSVNDTAGVYVENRSNSLEIRSTTAMAMYPNALTWPTLELGQTNRTSNNDPLIINNTGNKNINAGGITVSGFNLQGATVATDFINAENFSISPINNITNAECNGTQMSNGTSGQEELFFCLRFVPLGITRQTYNTAGASSSPWSIAVS